MSIKQQNISIHPLGDSALIVQLDNEVNEIIHRKILNLAHMIESNPFVGFKEVVPSYNSVTVFYNPIQIQKKVNLRHSVFEKVSAFMQCYLKKVQDETSIQANFNFIEIPVVYGGSFGPDIEYVANYNNITAERVIELHTEKDYLVYMIGFSPGFPFLGGVNKQISTPRKEKPSPAIPAGSVGIAGEQTGVYSLKTPGGWQIIGQTPVDLFTPNATSPTLLQSGDYIRFIPITQDEFYMYKEKNNEH